MNYSRMLFLYRTICGRVVAFGAALYYTFAGYEAGQYTHKSTLTDGNYA